jgi:hypothetical protein
MPDWNRDSDQLDIRIGDFVTTGLLESRVVDIGTKYLIIKDEGRDGAGFGCLHIVEISKVKSVYRP